MLQPVLGPPHRAPGVLAGQRHQRDVWIDARLDAEAAADVRGHVQPEPGRRDTERAGQHRDHAERAVEVGPGLDRGPFGRLGPVRHDAVALQRHGGVAGEGVVAADHVVGCGERLVDGAEAERAVGRDVGLRFRVQPRGVRGQSGPGIGDRGKLLVVHVDEFGGVLGQVPVGGDDHGDRLADEPDPVGRAREVGHRRPHRQRERAQFGHLGRADDRGHAGRGERPARVETGDPGVRERAAHDRGGQRARQRVQVVQEPALTAEQGGVLDPGQVHGRTSASGW